MIDYKARTKVLKVEQANMRAHLQLWHHIFFKMDNEQITPMDALAQMSDLYLVNPYDKVEKEYQDAHDYGFSSTGVDGQDTRIFNNIAYGQHDIDKLEKRIMQLDTEMSILKNRNADQAMLICNLSVTQGDDQVEDEWRKG